MIHWLLPYLLAVVAFVALLLAGLAFVGLRSGALGTRGTPIGRRDGGVSAIVVVDVQEDFTTRSGGRLGFDTDVLDRFFAVVNHVQAAARDARIPVVHVRQQFESLLARLFARLLVEGRGIAGRSGTRLDPRLEVAKGDVTFTKTQGDAFSNPGLDALLRDRSVDHVVILGLDGVACVNATARGALNRGYRVSLVRDGILTSRSRRWDEVMAGLERDGARVATGEEAAAALRSSRLSWTDAALEKRGGADGEST